MLKKLITSVITSLNTHSRAARAKVNPCAATTLQHAQELEANGLLNEAIDLYTTVLESAPDNVDALTRLGDTHYRAHQYGKAIQSYKKALIFDPYNREILLNLGLLYFRARIFDEASDCYETLLETNPNDAGALNNIGNIALEHGDAATAETYFRKALSANPLNATAFSNLLFCLNYVDTHTPADVFKEHMWWSNVFFPDAEQITRKLELKCEGRIKIGYISPNLKQHSVAYFFEPLLENHDKHHFEIYCYDDKNLPDDTTARLRKHANEWRVIAGQSDSEVASMIIKDEIQILVDLAGHTSTNRLALFAKRVAPIQVTYLGYPNTTGVPNMDYRISDAITDPAGITDRFHSERLARAPCAWCYRQPESAPEINYDRTEVSEAFVFGSFNKLAKMSPSVIDTWSRILSIVPNSKLFLKYSALSDVGVANKICNLFASAGVDAHRLILEGFADTTNEHFSKYNTIDIALDTFPYCGTTTTCEALYMGVPVVTLKGNSHVSRVGSSLLTCIGAPELITNSLDEYVGLAANLAQDSKKLANYRKTLRPAMVRSPLMGGQEFARNIEALYREMLATAT